MHCKLHNAAHHRPRFQTYRSQQARELSSNWEMVTTISSAAVLHTVSWSWF